MEENTGIKLMDLCLRIFFMNLSKESKNKMFCFFNVKLKSFCTAKETNKTKRQPTECETISVNNTSDKALIFQNIESSYNSTTKRHLI